MFGGRSSKSEIPFEEEKYKLVHKCCLRFSGRPSKHTDYMCTD